MCYFSCTTPMTFLFLILSLYLTSSCLMTAGNLYGARLFDMMDTDKDGRLSFLEFGIGMNYYLCIGTTPEERLQCEHPNLYPNAHNLDTTLLVREDLDNLWQLFLFSTALYFLSVSLYLGSASRIASDIPYQFIHNRHQDNTTALHNGVGNTIL